MKKLLSLLGSVGMLGAAGATVVACGNKDKSGTPEQPKTPKEALQAKITEADGLVAESSKTEEATNALKDAAEAAKTVLADEKSTEEQFTAATTTLDGAIETFNDSPEKAIVEAKEALQAKITEAEELVEDSSKTEEAIDALKAAIAEAKKVFDNNEANKEAITAATTTLDGAIETFNDSPEE